MKRPVLALLILFASIAALAFSPPAQEAPPRPSIRLDAAGQQVSEAIAAYCWPVAAGNNQCDFTLDFEPTTPLEVPSGQAITILLENNAPNLTALTLSLTDATGAVQAFDLPAEAQAIFEAPLPIGDNLLQVDAVYSEVAGVPAYVSFIFLVRVYDEQVALATQEATEESTPEATDGQGGAISPDATEAATEEASPEVALATEEATEEAIVPTPEEMATEVATEEATEVATEEVTEAATEEVTEAATEEASPTPTLTLTSTSLPTNTPTDVPTETPTELPTEELTEEVTQEATEEATTEATEAVTEEPEAPTATPTTVPSLTPTTASTLALIPTQADASPTPTNTGEAPSTAARPTSTTVPLVPPDQVVLPTATPSQTAIPTLPSPTPGPQPETAPEVQLVFAGQNYGPSGNSFCYVNASQQRICIENPSSSTAQTATLLQGFSLQFQIADSPRPAQIELTFLNADTLASAQTVQRSGDNLTLFNVEVGRGNYIVRVRVNWGVSTAEYFFRARVN